MSRFTEKQKRFSMASPTVDPDPDGRGYVYDDWRGSSPSQSETAARCMMRWWLDKIARVPRPEESEKQLFAREWGTAAHEQLEDVVQDKPIRLMKKGQAYVQEAHQFIKLIKQDVIGVEIAMELPQVEPLPPFYGRIDLLMEDGIIDHKTTSGFRDKVTNELKYCESVETLGNKIQTNIYASWWLRENPEADEVRITLNYIQRVNQYKGPANWQVSKVFTRAQIEENMIPVDALQKEMYASSKKHFNEVEQNFDACFDFRQECPYAAHCAGRKEKFNAPDKERAKTKREEIMARRTLASLMATTPAAETQLETQLETQETQLEVALTLETLQKMYLENDPELNDTFEAADGRLQVEYSMWRAQQIGTNPIPHDSRPDHEPGERVDKGTGDVITPVQELTGIKARTREILIERGCETLEDVCFKCTEENLMAEKGFGAGALKELTAALALNGLELGSPKYDKHIEWEEGVAQEMAADEANKQAKKVAAVKAKKAERESETANPLAVAVVSAEKPPAEKPSCKYTSITLGRTLNLGDYNSIRLELTADVFVDGLQAAVDQLIIDMGAELEKAALKLK